jgi:hypothetical protein
MQWAPRVAPQSIRRLYRLNGLGLYEEGLLFEVGEGLHARCRDALVVNRAMRGEVPCPACSGIVRRPKMLRQAVSRRPQAPRPFCCPHCKRTVTWYECREGLRNRPVCFDCVRVLGWRYGENSLGCGCCGRTWTWQEYRRSVQGRVWLPCPHCGRRVRRPEPRRRRVSGPGEPEKVSCPKCGARAEHARGCLSCKHCGYRIAWRKFRDRVKRRAERLECAACGHRFTWQSWRKLYRGHDLLTGNPAPLRSFMVAWPRCATAQEQMIAIDALLHAVHGRGALGPVLIDGEAAEVMVLLDGLSERR